jgi:long-chain acyl-CoA synthetase
MSSAGYLHSARSRVARLPEREGFVVLDAETAAAAATEAHALRVALSTIRLARRLGVAPTRAFDPELLPYADDHDNTVFDAPLTSALLGSRVRFMRGWKQYQSCVKGYNGLGLIAELVLADLDAQTRWDAAAALAERRAFVASRRDATGAPVFGPGEVEALSAEALGAVDAQDLAVWRVCATRTIVCSTSSNMGISLHEILRAMQAAQVTVAGRTLPLLGLDEGRLIIWCPDEEADFMNPEKTAFLRAIEAESPPLTTLHTYINRRQRDPGALQDALTLGGYFFPTNPQSADELQNLLANALRTLAATRGVPETALMDVPEVRRMLTTLGCRIEAERVVVTRGVESGLYGLMAAYLLMLEETLPLDGVTAISTWNQASIGAALAGAVLADEALRDVERLPPGVRRLLAEVLPATARWLGRHRLGQTIATRIHGVFDIANLQSLAQLLGVTVEKHLSGRGIAYVGLGSSSYANGNRCFEILKRSQGRGGPFGGKATFHPTTHTVNPVAQALVLAEDLYRLWVRRHAAGATAAEIVAEARLRVRKPEPAGAAALSGYLLARLDGGSLSVAELAWSLRLSGFDAARFLWLCGYSPDAQGAGWFVQEASEEGELMEGLAEALLNCLELPIEELETLAAEERAHSRANYRRAPLDPPPFEALEPVVNLYLTGDNTAQPDEALLAALVAEFELRAQDLSRVVRDAPGVRATAPAIAAASAVPLPPTSLLDLPGFAREIFVRNATRTFLVDTLAAPARVLTYADVHDRAAALAGRFLAFGLGRGDRLAILLPNGATLACTYFACLMSGVVAVPVNPALSPREIGAVLGLSGAKRLLTVDALAGRLTEAPAPDVLPRFGPDEAPPEGAATAGAPFEPFAGASADDLFLILFTSGTTSLPKGVVHTIGSILGNAATFNAVMGFGAGLRMLHIWPMAYSSGILNTLISPFMAEGSVVLVPAFDARSALAFWLPVMAHAVTTLWLSPTMAAALNAIDRDPNGPDYARRAIQTVCCGTAPLAQATREQFEAKYGVPLMESFGLTETMILTGQSPRYNNRPRSVGPALPGVEITIGAFKEGDESDGEAALGGEILVSTPHLMQGYVDPKTGGVDWLPPGTFFPTGDIGRFDGEGNLFITGRKKDLIIRGGQTISPAAVREVLLGLPMVQDAVVVGVHSAFYGEEVGAALILRSGVDLEAVRGSILQACRERLHAGAVPGVMISVPKFPLGSTGKILGREVKVMLEAAVAQGRGRT